METTTSAAESTKTVDAFLKALNDEDFKAARTYLTDDLQFIGVMDTCDGGDIYMVG
jgi:limonene-1,2-epoxide hydrolase